MRERILVIVLSFALAGPIACIGQLYTGTSGLIKNPSAEMNEAGDAMISSYFLNKRFTPDGGFKCDGKKYGTYDFSLSITPFRWIEIGYTFTLLKTIHHEGAKPKFNQKDRYFSLKLNPVREGKYVPAIAIGSNDFLGTPTKRHHGGGSGAGYFANYYVVLTKHFTPSGQTIGADLGYRYVPVSYGKKWQGVFASATWRPKWIPDFRLIGEWTGNEINFGADCLLWKHLIIQAAMIDCRYFTGGVGFKVNLF